MRGILATSLFALLATAPLSAQATGEIGYPNGSLGYDALMAGDLRTAEMQLLVGPTAKDDPALLINLGQVYARLGRTKEAEAAFRRVLDAPAVDLVLASGREVSSHRAASMALSGIARVATR